MRTAAEENEVPRYAPAIVGEKPELSPGESFTYMSMTPAMKHSEGSIQGAFLVRDCVSGESIEAEVGLFNMDFRVHNEYHHHSV